MFKFQSAAYVSTRVQQVLASRRLLSLASAKSTPAFLYACFLQTATLEMRRPAVIKLMNGA